jgi:YVTN family beta-propeller protein
MDPPKITRPPVPADRAERSRPRRLTLAALGGRWPGWVPPLAAAAAVAAVIAGTVGVSSALHRPGVIPSASPARQATAYVVNDTSPGTVTPIRTATNTALAPVKVQPHPDAIAIIPDGKTAYAVSTGESNNSGTVTPIRTATNTPLTPIKVGGDPVAIAITPDGRTAYVVNLASETVTPIRTATNTALAPVKVGGHPNAIAITPDGKTAYVANNDSGTVTPIRTATNTALAPVKVGGGPNAIAITPDGETAYVASLASATVTPIRTATNTPLTPIKVGGAPWTIAITPDGTTAYVASLASATVTPIRTATNMPLAPIKVGHSARYTIAITTDGKTAYVASPPVNMGRGTVTTIRTATNTALTPIKAVDHPMAIAITPRPGPSSWRRAPALSARLLLPSQTMAAGSSMTGQVLVDNHTGHAIHTVGCVSLFQVALTSRSYQPAVAWAACLQRFTIPPGLSRHRVTVWASYSQCSPARPRHGLRACLPGERMPPLPPGTYHARLFQARPLARIPPAITVRVIPARPGSAARLAGNGIGPARFGQPQRQVLTELGKLLGPPVRPYRGSGYGCGVDHTIAWPGLQAYFGHGRFTGYSYRGTGLQTTAGLQVGDSIRRARRLYRNALRLSFEQGGAWFARTPSGQLDGFTYGRSGTHTDIGPGSRIATIDAGTVGCAALSP